MKCLLAIVTTLALFIMSMPVTGVSQPEAYCPHKQICGTCKYWARTLTLRCDNLRSASVLDNLFRENAMNVSILDFSDSNLDSLPPNLCLLSNLETLNLSNNSIVTLNSSYLRCLKHLQQLILDDNRIRVIQSQSFQGTSELQALSLKRNNISEIGNDTFANLPKLRRVDLACNKLKSLDLWVFKMAYINNSNVDMPLVLNVSQNKLRQIINTVGASFHDLREEGPLNAVNIDFRNNSFRYIREFNFLNMLGISNIREAFTLIDSKFYTRFNPIDCDCDMYDYVKLFKNIFPYTDNWNIREIADNTVCDSPPEARHRVLLEIPKADFRCSIQDDCPDGCSCIRRPGNRTIKVTCPSNATFHQLGLPASLPFQDHLKLEFRDQNIHSIEVRDYLANITCLDVRSSSIVAINDTAMELLKNAEVLQFQDNKIKYPPKVLDRMRQTSWRFISFAKNPIFCDCHTAWFKDWLSESRDINMEKEDTYCHNGELRGQRIIDVPKGKFVCNKRPNTPMRTLIPLYICGTILVLVVGITLPTAIYRRKIQMLLFRQFQKKIKFGRTKKKPPPARHLSVDSINGQDDFVVDKLLDKNYKVYTRGDMSPGHTENNAFLDMMKQSKGIIMVVSREYLNNPSCGLRFREAFDFFIQYEPHFLIPVILEDLETLLASPSIDSDLKYFLKMPGEVHRPLRYKDSCQEEFFTHLERRLTDLLADDCRPLVSEEEFCSEGELRSIGETSPLLQV